MLISEKSISDLRGKINSSYNIFCRGLFLSARWFVISEVLNDGINLVILPDKESAEYCCSDLYSLTEKENVFFLPENGKSIERSNYKSSLNVQKTSAVESILNNSGTSIIVTYPAAIEEKIPSKKSIESAKFIIETGSGNSYGHVIEELEKFEFEKVDFVFSPGQFACRGSIIDIFSYSDNIPYRISFWGDEIEKINSFDINTQLSVEEKEKVEIIKDIISENSECYVFDILPRDSFIWLDSSDVYKECGFFKYTEGFRRIFIDTPLSEKYSEQIQFNIAPQPVFNKNFELLTEDIRNKLESGYAVYIYCEKESQAGRLKSIISQNCGLLPDFICGQIIHSGFIDNESKICCYSDHEIFDKFHRASIRKSIEKSERLTLNELNSFTIGDYVVHIDYGVGIFGGLVRIKDDRERLKEVVKIIYKDGDIVYVSVHALNKISRFRSKDGEMPKINKLGSKSWETLKAGAKSKVKDIAKELIQLYARRKASSGFAFSADTYLQDELESSFMYEDTPDQQSATVAVKRDMEDNCPMDRLICGDVGFGKTEIAVRAAFKAVADSKQVVVLVPTTILALQHYNTFKSRLENFPCNIDYVCRLRSAKDMSSIKSRLESGEIDILIGTHKILGEGFNFKDLGMLIIDEEQKFGVSAKEKIRKLKADVDTLTLTATPIPRTLQFSLLGARDLSIINTPPQNRIPVQTEVILFNEKEIKSIINYELNRSGQIFFIHNRVEELYSIETILHRLVPDMKICVAHGQMGASELENKILDFMKGDYDMLLCTTIVENGIDIPNANTIIINQAQNFGLSDLHQLRGRVGRTNKQAFCYLIVPPLASVTDDARRRLKAIEEFSDLGSGFNIAMQDLDIRGAGNLLGAQQSGFIMDMGFEAYQKVISEAMEELGIETGINIGNEKESFVNECAVETDKLAMIPDSYLDVTAEKIRIYRQLDSYRSEKLLDGLSKEMLDRFGELPEELENLFYVVKIRNLGSELGFEKVIVKNGMLICFFISNQFSPYYKSKTFEKVLGNINVNSSLFNLKQIENKLKTVSRGVDTLQKAYSLLSKLK